MLPIYFMLGFFVLAGVLVVWRMFGRERYYESRERHFREEWIKNDLERTLVAACDSPVDDSLFLQQFLTGQLFSPHAMDDPSTPITISARIHESIVGEIPKGATVEDDKVILGPWVWCFTSEARMTELRTLPEMVGLPPMHEVTTFTGQRLLEEAEQQSATLLVNPQLEFSRKFELAEIKTILEQPE